MRLPRPHQPSREEVLFGKLQGRIEDADRNLDGVLGVFVKDLKSGRSLVLHADEPFPTASTIKIAVLYELYRQAEEGKLDLAELTRPGCRACVAAACCRSWATAGEPELARPGLPDARVLRQRGHEPPDPQARDGRCQPAARRPRLPHVRLRRQMMDLEAARRGDENVATPAELR